MTSRSVPFRSRASRLWAGVAAAVVAVAAGAALLLRPAAPPQFTSTLAVSVAPSTLSPALLALATVNPPRYVASEARGPQPAGFAEAMRAYSAEDYAAATTRLRLVQLSDRADVQVNFFFGVSLLMSARSIDVPEAIEPFTRVVTSGDATYRQLASLYLGKAHIRLGRLAAAEREWERTQTLPGTHAREAGDLLKVLRTEGAAYR